MKYDSTFGVKGISCPYVQAPHTQHPHNLILSRFELFPHALTFCDKTNPVYSAHYFDVFVTYKEGFNILLDNQNLNP